MVSVRHPAAIVTCLGGLLLLGGCGNLGKVEQGRVIAYDPQTKHVTLIREPGVLPPVTILAPADPGEMGPEPAAGGLIRVDRQQHRIIVYDRAAQSFRTIPYIERRDVAKNAGSPVVDRTSKTITIYVPSEHALITFAASDELMQLPASTWREGDVVRYYYKDPGQALRLMNVTKTDLSKSG